MTTPPSDDDPVIPPMPKLGILWHLDQNLVERIKERERLIEERRKSGMWKRILGNWRPDDDTPIQ